MTSSRRISRPRESLLTIGVDSLRSQALKHSFVRARTDKVCHLKGAALDEEVARLRGKALVIRVGEEPAGYSVWLASVAKDKEAEPTEALMAPAGGEADAVTLEVAEEAEPAVRGRGGCAAPYGAPECMGGAGRPPQHMVMSPELVSEALVALLGVREGVQSVPGCPWDGP